MKAEQIERAQAAVRSGAVKWAPGMLVDGWIRGRLISAEPWEASSGSDSGWYRMTAGVVADRPIYPDLNDSSTCGALLQQVREAFDDPTVHVEWWEDGRWCVFGHGSGMEYGSGPTEGEALLDALERARGNK